MFAEYKKAIRIVIQNLVNEEYTPQEICNILNYNDAHIVEVELKQKIKESRFKSTQHFLE